jgi:hypothetical protein
MGMRQKNKVCKRILKKNIKDNDLDIPFNSHKLITASINVNSCSIANNICDTEEDPALIDKNHT